MIQTELELIERIIQKTKRWGLCWACKKKEDCFKMAENGENKELASGCVNFQEADILNSFSWR